MNILGVLSIVLYEFKGEDFGMNNKNTYGYTPEEYAKFKEFAWKVLLSFGLTYMFFYNGRQNINLVLIQMAEGLGSTTAAMGVVSSSLFWCYSFGQLINGRLGAYFGYKRFMMFGIAASVILNIFISFQSSIAVIALFWGLNGFCQSMVWANGIGVLNKWWPKKDRGFATGLATAFSGVAQIVTYMTILLCLDLNPEWGWRAAFRYPMLPMAIMLVVFAILFKNQPEDIGLNPFVEEDRVHVDKDEAVALELESKGFWHPYRLVFAEYKVIIFCFIAAIAGVGRYGLLTWIPTYFTESMGLSIKAGIISAILLPVGQACAEFAFPFMTDKFFNGKREPMLVFASVATFFGMILFTFVETKFFASITLLIVGMFSMIDGVIWAVAGDMGGKTLTSTVVGVLDWAVYMGAAVQAVCFGYVKDVFGWDAIFVTIGCLYLLMLILTLKARNMKMQKL